MTWLLISPGKTVEIQEQRLLVERLRAKQSVRRSVSERLGESVRPSSPSVHPSIRQSVSQSAPSTCTAWNWVPSHAMRVDQLTVLSHSLPPSVLQQPCNKRRMSVPGCEHGVCPEAQCEPRPARIRNTIILVRIKLNCLQLTAFVARRAAGRGWHRQLGSRFQWGSGFLHVGCASCPFRRCSSCRVSFS